MVKKTLGIAACAAFSFFSMVAGQVNEQSSTWQVLENAPVVQALSEEERSGLEQLCNALDALNLSLQTEGLEKLQEVFKVHPVGTEVLKRIANADAFGLMIQCVPLKMQDPADAETERVSLEEDEDLFDENEL